MSPRRHIRECNTITARDLHYLRSIKGMLDVIAGTMDEGEYGFMLHNLTYADNRDWLGDFIGRQERLALDHKEGRI